MRYFMQLLVVCGVLVGGLNANAQTMIKLSEPAEIKRYFQQENKRVVTFVGYSGAGYQDLEAMMATAKTVLNEFSPQETIINIGATVDGIGALYQLAKNQGFSTSGIVSEQALVYQATISPYVDQVFYVRDKLWGGIDPNTQQLSPTSQAMVENSDVLVAIGGGDVALAEVQAAIQQKRAVKIFPAEMDHARAIDRAQRKGLPVPTEFSGAIAILLN